jgi:WD40 repeat protein
MFSSSPKSEVGRKNISHRKIIVGVIMTIIGVRMLWLLPITRQAVILLHGHPDEIPLPILNAPNAITPETVKDIQLLEHWGNGTFESISWSPDSRYFAIGTTFGIDLYDAGTFELLQNIHIPVAHSYLPTFSPDSSRLAFAGGERFITLFDLGENKIIQQWEMAGPISIMTFLEDSTLVCVTEAGDVMLLIDDTWQLTKSLKDGFLTDVLFISEKQAFVAVYADSTQIINPYNGRSQKSTYVVPNGDDLLLSNNIRVEVGRDSSLVSAYVDDTLVSQITVDELFDQPIPSPKGGIMATLAMNPYDALGATITLWRIPSLEPIRTFRIPEASMEVGNEIVFSPDGEKLAVLASPSIVKIFPVGENSSLVMTLTDQFAGIGDIGISAQGTIWMVNCSGTTVEIIEESSGLSIDQWYFDGPTCGKLLDDGSSLAVSEPYENIRIYKVREVNAPVIVKAPCCSVFSANGSVGAGSNGAAGSGDPIVIGIWQQQFGLYQKWKYHQEGYKEFDVAVSSSGQYVAASSSFKTHLYVHGIESGRSYPSLGASINFSPDERLLASALRILDLETAKVIELEDNNEPLCSPDSFSAPAFSPDGQILAVAACSQLRFWRTSDGALLEELDDPYNSFEITFSPDSTFIVGWGIGNVDIWGIEKNVPSK